MKFCPECRESYPDLEDLCPQHGARLFAIAAPMRNVYDELVGQTIDGRYHLDEKVGEGGMGVVYSAHHTILAKKVAIKVLKKEVARDQSVVKRFIQEARAASTIGHANITDVHDFGMLPDGHSYFVMDFIQGPTLAKAMKDAGIMAPSRALPVMAQICRALVAAHDKGIVHRDLKPDNIFLTTREGVQDFVKIVDFGIAQMSPEEGSTRLTRAGMVFGTPEYMAPEQAAGRDIDHRVDIYAVGAILFEMMTGNVPHRGESVMATLAKVIMDPSPNPRSFNPNIHPALEHVIVWAMAKDRDQRCPDMRSLVTAIEDCNHKLAAAGIVTAPLGSSGSGSFAAMQPPTMMEQSAPLVRGKTAPPGREPSGRVGTRHTPPGLRSIDRVDLGGTGAMATIAGKPEKKSKTGLIIILVLAVAGATVAVALMMRGKKKDDSHGAVPPVTIDAGVKVALSTPDAGGVGVNVPPGQPVDAGTSGVALHPGGEEKDAGLVAVRPTPDASVGGNPPNNPPSGGDEMIEITVKTSPDPKSKILDDSGKMIGQGKVTLKKKKGTKFHVVCDVVGFYKGSLNVTFKKDTTVTCSQNPVCNDDLQNPNPLAHCPE